MTLQQVVELTPVAYARGGANVASGLALPAPSVDQSLSISHRGRQFNIKELILELAIERLGKTLEIYRGQLDACV